MIYYPAKIKIFSFIVIVSSVLISTLSGYSDHSGYKKFLLIDSFLIWFGVYLCILDNKSFYYLRPSKIQSLIGLVLLIFGFTHAWFQFSPDLHGSAVPLIVSLGLFMLIAPLRLFHRYIKLFFILSLASIEIIVDYVLNLTNKLSHISVNLLDIVFMFFGIDSSVIGNSIIWSDYKVTISGACSGKEILFQTITISIIFLLAFPLKNKYQIILLSIIAPIIALLSNLARISLLSLFISLNNLWLFDRFHGMWGSLIFGSLASIIFAKIYIKIVERNLSNLDLNES